MALNFRHYRVLVHPGIKDLVQEEQAPEEEEEEEGQEVVVMMNPLHRVHILQGQKGVNDRRFKERRRGKLPRLSSWRGNKT